mmetsp:Transcript_8000/g.22325  ORF Transcript_8000/g.22325 Transcript_8000/m.22325 type:complete len:203 (+) Transcript_8000:517-1125(+)
MERNKAMASSHFAADAKAPVAATKLAALGATPLLGNSSKIANASCQWLADLQAPMALLHVTTFGAKAWLTMSSSKVSAWAHLPARAEAPMAALKEISSGRSLAARISASSAGAEVAAEGAAPLQLACNVALYVMVSGATHRPRIARKTSIATVQAWPSEQEETKALNVTVSASTVRDSTSSSNATACSQPEAEITALYAITS